MDMCRIRGTVSRFALVVAIAALAVPGAATQVTMKGKPVTLLGDLAQQGDEAPDFTALDNGFQAVSLGDFAGRPILISAVPSLDTPVCSTQTKHFHDELAKLPESVVFITISMDLPTAQKRFCSEEGIDRMLVLSDSARREFGEAYGVLIPDRGLLARSVFVIDADGTLRHVQLVPEITSEPDYDVALAALRGSLGR